MGITVQEVDGESTKQQTAKPGIADSRLVFVTMVLGLAAAIVLLAHSSAANAEQWSRTPEGVAREFVSALVNLDLDRIMQTQTSESTMFFPYLTSRRLDGHAAIRTSMQAAFVDGRARASAAGRSKAPYIVLPEPISMTVQYLGEEAAVVSWMFDRPGSFGRRSATVVKTAEGWRMIHFHSSNIAVGGQ